MKLEGTNQLKKTFKCLKFRDGAATLIYAETTKNLNFHSWAIITILFVNVVLFNHSECFEQVEKLNNKKETEKTLT